MSAAILVIVFAMMVSLVLLAIFVLGAQSQTPRLLSQPNWDALLDDELQSYLPNRKINAIKRYRELTGAGLKDAKEIIEYIIANPDAPMKNKRALPDVETGAGLRDLITAGRMDEAVQVYAQFMGVDQFTAQDSVERLQQVMVAEGAIGDDQMLRIQRLVDEDETAEALVEYQRLTGADLDTAEAVIDSLRE